MLPDHELDALIVFKVRVSVPGHGSRYHDIATFRDHDLILFEHAIVRCLDMVLY